MEKLKKIPKSECASLAKRIWFGEICGVKFLRGLNGKTGRAQQEYYFLTPHCLKIKKLTRKHFGFFSKNGYNSCSELFEAMVKAREENAKTPQRFYRR